MDGLIEQRQPTLDRALELLARIRAEAEAQSLSLALCVVDPGGNVIAGQRMDGAALGAMQLAVGKAYTAVLWGTRSGDFMGSTQPGGDDWGFNATDPRIVVYAGGLPLYVDGALVGSGRQRRNGGAGRGLRPSRCALTGLHGRLLVGSRAAYYLRLDVKLHAAQSTSSLLAMKPPCSARPLMNVAARDGRLKLERG